MDVQATDWQTVVTRRTSQKPPKEGGWNMFFTNWAPISGRGKNGGWIGWAEDAKIEAMRDAFVRASSPEEQKKIAADIQQEVYDQVILYPLGEFLGEAADCGW